MFFEKVDINYKHTLEAPSSNKTTLSDSRHMFQVQKYENL